MSCCFWEGDRISTSVATSTRSQKSTPVKAATKIGSGRVRSVSTWAWFRKCHFQVTPEIDRAMMVKGFLVFECYPFLNHALFEPRRYSSSASAIAAASPKDRMPSLRSGRSAGRSSTWSNRETSSAGSRHSADLCARLSRSIPEQPLLSRRTRRENPLALAIHRASVALSRHN